MSSPRHEPLKRLVRDILGAVLMSAAPMLSRREGKARAEHKKMAVRLGLDRGQVIRRGWVRSQLTVMTLRPGQPEDVLAEMVSAAAAQGYPEEGFRAEVHGLRAVYPPPEQGLPNLLVGVYGPGAGFPDGTAVPPGYTGLTVSIS